MKEKYIEQSKTNIFRKNEILTVKGAKKVVLNGCRGLGPLNPLTIGSATVVPSFKFLFQAPISNQDSSLRKAYRLGIHNNPMELSHQMEVVALFNLMGRVVSFNRFNLEVDNSL